MSCPKIQIDPREPNEEELVKELKNPLFEGGVVTEARSL